MMYKGLDDTYTLPKGKLMPNDIKHIDYLPNDEFDEQMDMLYAAACENGADEVFMNKENFLEFMIAAIMHRYDKLVYMQSFTLYPDSFTLDEDRTPWLLRQRATDK